mgnify:CR=1 FL=1
MGRAIGIGIFFVSGEGEPLASIIQKLNELPSVKSGLWTAVGSIEYASGAGKVEGIEAWLQKKGFVWSECVYIGDDVNDYQAMKKVKESGGVVVVPANAAKRIRPLADIILRRSGGAGAIREFSELVVEIRGIDEVTLPAS